MQEIGDLNIRTVLAVLLIGMSLLALTPQNAARTAKSTKAQSGSFLSMYENVTTHEGDLIINGTQNFVIENCTYMQTGNIYVSDYAKLIIRNVALNMSRLFHPIIGCLIVDHWATLEMTNSIVHNGWLGCFGDSQASINGSFLEGTAVKGEERSSITSNNCSSDAELGLTGDSKTLVLNSSFLLTTLCFETKQVGNLGGLKPGYFDFWNLRQNQTVQDVDYDLVLLNTSVGGWVLEMDYDAMVVVSNSSIDMMRLRFRETTTKINGLRSGFYETWSNGYITLENTSVALWIFHFFDSIIEVRGAEAGVYASGSSSISITNSNIESFWTGWFSGTVYFNQSNVVLGQILESGFYMLGNVAQLEKDGEWIQSNVTRNYSIITTDISGNPMGNVELTLLDQNNTLVWVGTADSSSGTNFNLTFTDSNYTDTLRLEAVKGNLSGTQNVTFLSDTPVIVELGLHDDAITNAMPLKTVVGQGFPVHMNVTPLNRGNFTETFNVTVYANNTKVEMQPVTLENDTSTTMTFTWNTTGSAYGNYTIDAVADIVPNEADATDNNFTCDVAVHVGVPGDVSGPTQGEPDGKCGMRDISWIIIHFNGKPGVGDRKWLPNCDINNDNVINMRDITIAILHFNQQE